jgi:hypothetical protein
MAKTSEPTVTTDGKGISAPPADEERRSPAPADATGNSPEPDNAEGDLSTTGKGIS